MRSRLTLSLGLAAALVVPAHVPHAQADAPNGPHYITVTTFDVPIGEASQQVNQWIDSVMVPLARLNPNVLARGADDFPVLGPTRPADVFPDLTTPLLQGSNAHAQVTLL
jgi:hypothetical protein